MSNIKQQRPSVIDAIHRNRPEGATSYRLLDGEGRRLPASDCAPFTCLGRVELPSVQAGTYKILYFDRDDREVPQPNGYPAPLLELDHDLRVLTSPARFEAAEHFREIRLERAELENRARLAMVSTIESQAKVIVQKDAAAIDMQQSINTVMQNMVDLQGKLAQQQKDYTEFTTSNQARMAEMIFRTVEEAANRLASRTNWADVVKEGIKEASGIGQLVIAAARAVDRTERADRSERKSGTEEGGGRLPGQTAQTAKTAPALPAAAPGREQNAPAPASNDDDDEGSWFLSFFGLTDKDAPTSEPKRAEGQKKESAAPPASAKGADSGTETGRREPVSEAAQRTPRETPQELPQETPQEPSKALVRVDSVEAADQALKAIDELSAMLDRAVGRAPQGRPRPAVWSPTWAWNEIKRRVRDLSDTQIALITSSADGFLSFLRELGSIAAPVRSIVQGGAA